MAVFSADDFLTRAAKTCCEISKAKSDFPLEEGKLYLSADTIVVSDNQVFNKPENLEEAKQMLMSYFGHSHHVVTSVCLRQSDYLEVFYTVARIDFVDFYPELEAVVDDYIQNKRPLDKAGAYGIQELDPRFIKGIEGDIHTIIGLPVAEVSWRIFGR
jgi:septum formation protein